MEKTTDRLEIAVFNLDDYPDHQAVQVFMDGWENEQVFMVPRGLKDVVIGAIVQYIETELSARGFRK